MKVSQPTQVTYGRMEDTEVAETRTSARAAHIAATIVLSLETVETVTTSPRPAISCDLEICDVDWSPFSSRVTTPGPARYQDTAMQTLCSVHCCMMVTVRTVQYLASRHAGAVLYPGYSWKRTFAKLEVSQILLAIQCHVYLLWVNASLTVYHSSLIDSYMRNFKLRKGPFAALILVQCSHPPDHSALVQAWRRMICSNISAAVIWFC